MAIKIPPDAPVVTDSRLTLIRILSTFAADDGRLDALKAAVKAAMRAKHATYAQSDLAVARLVSSTSRQFVDPRKLHGLIKAKRITLKQFLDVICVRTSLLPPLLSGAEIKDILMPPAGGGDGDGALYTDFKADVHLDFDAIEAAILRAAGAEAA